MILLNDPNRVRGFIADALRFMVLYLYYMFAKLIPVEILKIRFFKLSMHICFICFVLYY